MAGCIDRVYAYGGTDRQSCLVNTNIRYCLRRLRGGGDVFSIKLTVHRNIRRIADFLLTWWSGLAIVHSSDCRG